MKGFRFLIVFLLVVMVVSGCSKSNEVAREKGKSDHWKAEYIITHEEDAESYMILFNLSFTDPSQVVYDMSYDITSEGIGPQLSGSSTSSDKSGKTSTLINNTISTSISMYRLPEEGKKITLTIKWNADKQEKIILIP